MIRRIKYTVRFWLGYYYPEILASILFKKSFGRKIDWNSPRDMNEKIQWLKFRSDTSQWTQLADKYKVREYVEQCGCGSVLNELYGVWKDADELDFRNLPDTFVLKTNHGCGTILVISNKNKVDIRSIRLILNNWLNVKYGCETAEPHYTRITPCIIAEKYLEADPRLSSSLIDYKFLCFDGKPYSCLVCHDRVNGHGVLELYDIHSWKKINHHIPPGHAGEKDIPEPVALKEMLYLAGELSKGFPFVRVDLYEIDGKVLFGELTFTPAGGYIEYFTSEYLHELGKQIVLPVQIRNKILKF